MIKFIRTLCILAAAALACKADEFRILSVDTNKASNVQDVRFGSLVATNGVTASTVGSKEYTFGVPDSAVFDGYSYNYTSTNNSMVSILIPTNYPVAYEDYLNGNVTIDRFATEWFVNKSVLEGVEALKPHSTPQFYIDFTNRPPTNITSLVYYVSNCVVALSNVQPEPSYRQLEENVSNLTSRVVSVEKTAGAFGSGMPDLDYILDSKMEELDAEDLFKMIKSLALYIKTGSTNEVSGAASNE